MRSPIFTSVSASGIEVPVDDPGRASSIAAR